tara:strand:- start:1345 stop:4203 length:2859 start_codon:yes stop_codon:yes gene_type:complete
MGRTNTTTADSAGLVTVGSSAGFDAGDLIYQTVSDTGLIPNGFISTDNFAATKELSVVNPSSDYWFGAKYIEKDGGLGKGVAAALLSDGNVAYIYFRTQNVNREPDAYANNVFVTVRQPDDSVVMQEHQSNNNNLNGNNGRSSFNIAANATGFVVCWIDNTDYVCWRQYTNNGVPVNATHYRYTGQGDMAYAQVLYMPNGSTCFLAMRNSNSTADIWLSTAGSTSVTNQVTISTVARPLKMGGFVDSSNQLHVAYGVSGSIYRRIYNSTLGVVSTDTVKSNIYGDVISVQIAVSSTDKMMILSTGNSNDYINVITKQGLAAGTWDAAVALNNDHEVQNLDYTNPYIANVTGTENFFCYTDGRKWSQAQFLDTNGVQISPILQQTTTDYGTAQGARALIKTSSDMKLIAGKSFGTAKNYMAQGQSNVPVAYVKIDNNYNLVSPNYTDPVTVGTASASVNLYSKAESTPRNAKFLATGNSSSFTVTEETATVTDFMSGRVSLTTDFYQNTKVRGLELNNGNIVVIGGGVGVSSLWPLQLTILDPNYVQLSKTNISSNGNNTHYLSAWDITKLANGNIVVCYIELEGGNRNTYANVYSPTMSFIKKIPLLGANSPIGSFTINTSDATMSCSGIPYLPNSFILFFRDSSNICRFMSVDTSNSTLLFENLIENSATFTLRSVSSVFDSQGNIWVSWHGSSAWRFYRGSNLLNNGNFTWYSIGGFGTANYGRLNQDLLTTASGAVHFPYNQSDNTYLRAWRSSNKNQYTTAVMSDNRPDNNGMLIGQDGKGNITFFYNTTQSPNGLQGWLSDDGDRTFMYGSAAVNYLSGGGNSSKYSVGHMFAGRDTKTHVIWKSTIDSTAHSIAPVYMRNSSFGLTTTAGVTSSQGIILNPVTSAFIGVSATECAAGGTGVVQAKGAAILSSAYSASTPQENFDFREPTTKGVSGLINGRNVTLGD